MKKVAVINSSDEIVEAIQLALSTEGFATVGGHIYDFKSGKKNFANFLEKEKPDAVLVDIAPPYDSNWNFFQTMRNLAQAKTIAFVITTTNEARLKEIVNDEYLDVIEIIGKPFDIKLAVMKVEAALDGKK